MACRAVIREMFHSSTKYFGAGGDGVPSLSRCARHGQAAQALRDKRFHAGRHGTRAEPIGKSPLKQNIAGSYEDDGQDKSGNNENNSETPTEHFHFISFRPNAD